MQNKQNKSLFIFLEAISWGIFLFFLIQSSTGNLFSLAQSSLFIDAQSLFQGESNYNTIFLLVLKGFASALGVFNFNQLDFYLISNLLCAVFSVLGLFFFRLSIPATGRIWFAIVMAAWFQLASLAGFHPEVAATLLFLGLGIWLVNRDLSKPSLINQVLFGLSLGVLANVNHNTWLLAAIMFVFFILKKIPKIEIKTLVTTAISAITLLFFLNAGQMFPLNNVQVDLRFFYHVEAFWAENLPNAAKFFWASAFSPLIGICIVALMVLTNAAKSKFNWLKNSSSIAFIVLVPAALFLFKTTEKGDISMLLPFVVLVLVGILTIENGIRKIGDQKIIPSILFIVIISSSLVNQPYFQYFTPNFLFNPWNIKFYIQEETDYLAVEDYKAIESRMAGREMKLLAHNYPVEMPSSSTPMKKMRYEQRAWAKYDYAVISKTLLSPNEKLTSSLSNPEFTEIKRVLGFASHLIIPADTAGYFAKIAMDKGQLGDAIGRFKNARKIHPKHEGIAFLLAKCQYELSLWDEALTSLEIALAYQPEFIEARCLKAQILLKQTKTDEAIGLLNETLKLEPKNAKTIFILGSYYLYHGQVELANSYFKTTQALGGHFGKKAEQKIALITELGIMLDDPNMFTAEMNKIVESGSSSYDELLGFKKALNNWARLDSSNADIFNARGMCNMFLQEYQNAINDFNQTLSINPNLIATREYLSQAHVNRGVAYFKMDSFDLAQLHFSYALDYNPADDQAMKNSAVALTEMAKIARKTNLDEAISYLTRAIELYNYPEAHIELGDIALEKNDEVSVEISFYRAHQLNPKLKRPLQELIKLYKKRGDKLKVDIYTKRLKKLGND